MPQKGSAVFKNGHGTGKVREMVRETVWEPSTIWLILETVYTLTLARGDQLLPADPVDFKSTRLDWRLDFSS